MPALAQDQLIRDITREVLAQIAPQELPLLRHISEAYFKDPDKTLKGQASKDEMLGFGVPEGVVFITPIVLAVVTDVLKYIGEHVLNLQMIVTAATIDILKQILPKFRPDKPDKGETPPLSAEQIAQIRRLIIEKATQLRLPQAKAEILANAIVVALFISS